MHFMNTDMKKTLLTIIILLSTLSLFGQNYNVREEVAGDMLKASGLDNLIDFNVPALTKAPKGYEPFYISHYGRHGSRYAYTEKTYTNLFGLLEKADTCNNLTAKGKEMLDSVRTFYNKVKLYTGDLTETGWDQHKIIAETMVKVFPNVFAKGSRVDAVASAKIRSVVSMTSFCTALGQARPNISIYAHQGIIEQQATAPNIGKNKLRYKGPALVNPYSEDYESFFERKMPGWKGIYERLFKDADKALEGNEPVMVTLYAYMLVAGMPSIPQEHRVDLAGLFTKEEFNEFWEVDNYMRFKEYYKYQTSCCSVLDDIIAKADRRIADGERGADLRFGHDHVMMTLFMLLNMNNFAHYPATNDELLYWFQSFLSPMGTNIQLVFYRPKHKRNGEVLVKFLVNGIESHFTDTEPSSFPYYKWEDVKSYMQKRVKEFVTERPLFPTVDDVHSVSGNNEFLVRRDNRNLYLGVGS